MTDLVGLLVKLGADEAEARNAIAHHSSSDRVEAEKIRAKVEYWKQVIYVQTHFNDMCIRTRWVGLTVNATLLAGAAVTLAQFPTAAVQIQNFSLHIGAILFCVASLLSIGLWQLDRLYYYKMLITSVAHATTVEKEIAGIMGNSPESLITGEISKELPQEAADGIVNLLYFGMVAVPLWLAALTVDVRFALISLAPFVLLLLGFAKAKFKHS